MATIRKRKQRAGEYWYLYWWERGPDGRTRQRSQSLGRCSGLTRRQAEARRAEKEQELQFQRDGAPLTPFFADFAHQYLRWHSEQYPSSYYRVEQIFRTYLIPTFGHFRLGRLGPLHLEKYKEHRRNAAISTVIKEVRQAKAIMNWAVDMEVITKSPWAKVKPPRDLDDEPPRYFTHGELQAIYAVAPSRASWWRFLANTGLRRGEALKLRWERVGRDMVTVVSTNRARSKSGKSRVVPLNASAREALEGLRAREAVSAHWHDDFVFPQMADRSLTRAFRLDAEKAGVEGTIHDLRHTFGAHMALNPNTRMRALQQIMGHASMKTTEKYSRLVGRDIERDVEGIAL